MPIPALQSVLLIDDNPSDRLLVRRQMNQAFSEASIQEVYDQAQLDAALAEDSYELVITDYRLGWSNGIKVLKAVKQVRPECPVVMFTNTGTEEIAVAAMKLGLDDYVLKKPEHFDRLAQAVRSTWQKFQSELRATELEGRLQALLNQLKVGIFRATPAGELTDANLALFKMIGVESIEVAQSVWASQLRDRIAALNSPSVEASSEANVEASSAELTQEIKIKVENPASSTSKEPSSEAKAESTRWLRISATLNTATKTPVIDGLVEDITARKQAQQSLQEVNVLLEKKVRIRTRQLERSNRELESFAYSISHDLRTPIRQIASFVGLIEDHLEEALNESTAESLSLQTGDRTDSPASQPQDQSEQPSNSQLDETTQQYLAAISELAVRSEAMIRSLLNLSQMGRTAMVVTPVDMAALVEQEIEQINRSSRRPSDSLGRSAPLAQRHAASFTVQPMPVIACDRTLIRAVWQNLIDNALKFTQNEPAPQITLGVKPPMSATDAASPASPNTSEASETLKGLEETIFFIQDNGIGFSPDQAEKIFSVFQQAHSKRDFGGNGIGLANVMRIISRHKGRVWAEGAEGKGAAFYFSLPNTYAGEEGENATGAK